MKYLTGVTALVCLFLHTSSAQDTLHVESGWNNIGSLESDIAPSELVTVPPGILGPSIYAYTPGSGYAVADILEKGRGYWVKVIADGIIIFGEAAPLDSCGLKQVSYEGGPYPTVRIGDQCWLAKNLNVGSMVTGVTEQTDNSTLEKYCYDNNEANCTTFGGLYQWNEAMQYSTTPGTQGICPPGWHIPTDAEIQTLSVAVDGDGNALKTVGQGTGDGAGTNTSGFSAMLVGGRYDVDGGFYSLDYNAGFWSSTEYDAPSADFLFLEGLNSYIYLYDERKAYGLSVRCLED